MIAETPTLDQPTIDLLREQDALVQRARALFALLDWSQLEQQQASRHCPGPHPHPGSAYLKAFLLKIIHHLPYMTHLRTFLCDHPLLVLELGFRPVPDASQLYGFDVQRTVPSDRWLREKLYRLDPIVLSTVLEQTVHALQAEIPGLGEVVAFDVKHIYAWVRENNPRESMRDRFCKERQPKGDPDCRVGVKKSTNVEHPDGSKKEVKEYLWGYGSGVAAATTPDYGDVVLAEYTQPFNEADVSYSPFLSIPMAKRKGLATRMEPHCAPKACACTRPISFGIPTAFAPNAFVARCCFQSALDRPVTMSSSPKPKAV